MPSPLYSASPRSLQLKGYLPAPESSRSITHEWKPLEYPRLSLDLRRRFGLLFAIFNVPSHVMANPAASFEFARCGPVHFQPIEMELEPLGSFISGTVLNAGCGHRNIDGPLLGAGATSVVNFDLESSIPGAILGMLGNSPFEADSFDTIFCNAVLEHTPEIDRVMADFYRIMRPGGTLILGVPFLQPFHADPWDFRRYTKPGLEALGVQHGFTPKEALPVHTIAQTLGWIAWEWALEKGGWRKPIVYPIVWLATRIFYRTDMRLQNNANTFQCIFQKPV